MPEARDSLDKNRRKKRKRQIYWIPPPQLRKAEWEACWHCTEASAVKLNASWSKCENAVNFNRFRARQQRQQFSVQSIYGRLCGWSMQTTLGWNFGNTTRHGTTFLISLASVSLLRCWDLNTDVKVTYRRQSSCSAIIHTVGAFNYKR